MRVVFISGKIRARTSYAMAENIRHAHEVAVRLAREGWATICPHTMSRDMGGALHENPRKDFEKWMAIDIAILERLRPNEDAIYMLKGWRGSEGSRMELKKARELGLKILFEEGEAE